MVIQVLETVTKGEERKRERLGSVQPNFSSVWHTDCLVVHRTVSGAPGWSPVKRPLSGVDDGVRLKFTGLSSGAPDCPVSHPR
jgi:hypothetical protein